MSNRWWIILAVMALAGCVTSAMAEDKPAKDEGGGFSFGKGSSGPFGDDPIDVSGGELKYVAEEKAVAILGYSTLVKGGYTVKARNMVYFRETKEIYAEGDVLLMEPSGSTMRCDSLYFNFGEERGERRMLGEARNVVLMSSKGNPSGAPLSKPSDMSNAVRGPGKSSSNMNNPSAISTVFVRADVIRSNTSENQDVYRATVSTDNAPKEQIFKITASEASIRHDNKVESWNNVLWFG